MRLKHIPTILLLVSFLSGCSSTQSSTEPTTKTSSAIPFESTEVYKSIKETFLTSMEDASPTISYDKEANTIELITRFPDLSYENLCKVLQYDTETAEYWEKSISTRTKICSDIKDQLSENGYADVNVYTEQRDSNDIGIYAIYNGKILYNLTD